MTKFSIKNHKEVTKEFLELNWLNTSKSLKDLSVEYGIPLSILESRASIYKVKKGGKRVFFDNSKIDLNNPIFCYFVGLVVTDGYINIKKDFVSLRMKNEGIKKIFKIILNYFDYKIKVKEYKNKNFDISLCSKELVDFFTNLGVSKNKTFKCPYINVPDKNKPFFWRGILDGDGNIKKTGEFRLVMASELFIEGFLADLNNTLGLSLTMRKHKCRENYYPLVEMRKSDSKIFLTFVYKEYLELALPLKLNNFILNYKKDEDIVQKEYPEFAA